MASASNADSSSLAARFDAAAVVVAGEVTAVRPVPAAASRGGFGLTEHAPLWCDATIAVSAAYKGRATKTVRVRFPSSTDVAWARTPKLEKGQKGIFFLTRDGATFTTPHPADVQSLDQTHAIAALATARAKRPGVSS